MSEKFRRTLTAGLALTMLLPTLPAALSASVQAADVKVVNLNESSVYNRSMDEIIKRYNEALPANLNASVYKSRGSNTNGNYVAAEMTDEAKKSVLKLSNYYRWLEGLSEFTAIEDSAVWDQNAKGAVLLSVTDFSHTPDKPDDMSDSFYSEAYKGTSSSSIAQNWGITMSNLLSTLRMWINDDYYTETGHRNMFFTRNGTQLAYGMFSTSNECTYSCQRVKYFGSPNPSGNSYIGNDEPAYVWPAAGYAPAEDTSKKSVWTITLNTDKLKFSSLSDLNVVVTDKAAGTSYTRNSPSKNIYYTGYWGKTISFDPPELSESSYAGKKYSVRVTGFKDGSGSNAELVYDVNFFSYTPLKNNSTIASTSVSAGTGVKLTGSAQGGTKPYYYTFQYQKEGASKWTAIGTKNSTSSTAEFKVDAGGKYTVRSIIKDSSGASASKSFKVTVTGNAGIVNNSTISASSVYAGQTVKINGAASGGTAPYYYTIQYKKPGSTVWSTKGDKNSTVSSAELKPGKSGTYTVRCIVKDSKGAVSTKNFSLTVNTAPALVNSSTISASSVKKGTAVKLTAKADGGVKPYNYTYQLKKPGSSSWINIGTKNTEETSASFKPSVEGTYAVRVILKDVTGKSDIKTFSLKVNA